VATTKEVVKQDVTDQDSSKEDSTRLTFRAPLGRTGSKSPRELCGT
jgi:hypothetical protein